MTIAALLGTAERPVVQVATTATMRELVGLLTEHRIGAVPVMEDDAVVGILSERDIVAALGREGERMLDWPVERVMTRPAITITPEMSILACLSLMTKRRIRHLPVLANGRMIGFVSIGDLVKARIERIEHEADAMRAYISQ